MKRSRPKPSAKFDPGGGIGHSQLVQTTISKSAEQLLNERVAAAAISKSAYVRQVLYRHLGIIKDDKES